MRHRNDIKDSTVLNLYLRKNLSMPAIAKKFKVTQRTIWERLKRYGVTGATKNQFVNVPISTLIDEYGPQKECKYCGDVFVPIQHNQLYCCRNCMRASRSRNLGKRGVGVCPNCKKKVKPAILEVNECFWIFCPECHYLFRGFWKSSPKKTRGAKRVF